MDDLNVYLIRFNNNGMLCKAVVIAERFHIAERILKEQYKEYNIEIDIEDWECYDDEGVVLTWSEPEKYDRYVRAVKNFEIEYSHEHAWQIENAKGRNQFQKGALKGFEHVKRIFDKYFHEGGL